MSEGWLGLAWIFFAPSEMMARGGKSKNLKGENESEKEGLSRLCKGFLSLSLSLSLSLTPLVRSMLTFSAFMVLTRSFSHSSSNYLQKVAAAVESMGLLLSLLMLLTL